MYAIIGAGPMGLCTARQLHKHGIDFFPQASGMLLIAAFWGCWHLVSGLTLAFIWLRRPPASLPLATAARANAGEE